MFVILFFVLWLRVCVFVFCCFCVCDFDYVFLCKTWDAECHLNRTLNLMTIETSSPTLTMQGATLELQNTKRPLGSTQTLSCKTQNESCADLELENTKNRADERNC